MIGGAPPILALPVGGGPGAIPSPPAVGDGFGAVFGALGAALVAIGDAAGRGPAVAEGDAPVTPETAPDADGAPMADILDVMPPLNGATGKPGTEQDAAPNGIARAPVPESGLPVEDGPPTTTAPIADKTAAESGDPAKAVMAGIDKPHPGPTARAPMVSRAVRASDPIGTAMPIVGDSHAESPPDAEDKGSDGEDSGSTVPIAAATPVAASIPVIATIPAPDVAARTALPKGDATDESGSMPAAAAKRVPASVALQAKDQGKMPAAPAISLPIADSAASMAAPAQAASFIPPAASGAVADPASASTEAIDVVAETPAAPATLPASSPAPRSAALRGNGVATTPVLGTPAETGRAMPVRETQAAPPPVDGDATVEATRSTASDPVPAVSQPQAPTQAAPSPAPVASAAAAPVPAPVPANDMAQVVMGHHLDLARDSAWLDQLARDIVSTSASDSQLRFKLNPEHLGSLHVELLRRDDGAAVRMTTESEAARSMLADAQGRLVAEARTHGMRITETSVDLNRNGGGNHGESGQRGWGDAPSGQSGQSGQPNPQPRARHVNASVTMNGLNGDRIEARPARRDLYA